MPQIHPTAIVDDQAELADDAIVGPWCLIEGPVKLGPGCRLLHRVSLKGPLTVGVGNVFYPNVVLGYSGQDLKYDHQRPGVGVVIGDNNVIREGTTIHRATGDRPTTIGNNNYLMANSHIGHDCRIGNRCMLGNGVLMAGHAQLADRVIIGGNTGIHQFVRIGQLVMLSGLIGLAQDVPPYVTCHAMRLVGSLNLIGLRRAGLREHIEPLKKAFKILYMSRLSRPSAVQRIRRQCGDDPLCVEFADFVETTKRGITPYSGKYREASDSD